jgi:SAM-dependent methyltransferase
MKQNKYDEPDFFAKYSKMLRSVGGLESAGEWPAFRELLPVLRDKRLLDLGCGFGWHCRYAREQGARFVVGVDLSERMLERAKANTNDTAIEYRRSAIEDIDFPDGYFDVVISSLALHYVRDFGVVCQRVSHWLTTAGAFFFSVEPQWSPENRPFVVTSKPAIKRPTPGQVLELVTLRTVHQYI